MGRAPLSRTLVISLLAMTYGASAQQPSFRVSTSRVVVDVVATDARDRVVTDLTATDFDVLLNGRRQKILEFQRIDISSPRRNTALVDAQPFLDTATNARPGPRGRAFAFILDDPALDPADIFRFKRMMVEFLRGLSPDDQVAMTYVTRSDLSQDFSRDEARLVRAVNNINAAVGTGA